MEIPRRLVREALDVLGIESTYVQSVLIEPTRVTVVAYKTNERTGKVSYDDGLESVEYHYWINDA